MLLQIGMLTGNCAEVIAIPVSLRMLPTFTSLHGHC